MDGDAMTIKPTDQTLLEQMRITAEEIEYRKSLLSLTARELQLLAGIKPKIEQALDNLVTEFYQHQTAVSEIALLIGDADTLARLQSAQRRYLLDLFNGNYDIEYVNNRLRIGLVHKRIGVEPKLYLAAIHTLKTMLIKIIRQQINNEVEYEKVIQALEKLFMFDITLVVETYVRSLITEITASKAKVEQYANMLELKTQQLEEVSRTDALTGLLNVRHLSEVLSATMRAAQRRSEPVTVVYIDVDNFKLINDNLGHIRGDEVLRTLAYAIKQAGRMEDHCFRCGGDEFCIILPNCTEAQAREGYVLRLLQFIEQVDDTFSISIGFKQADSHDDYINAESLIKEADDCMYMVKKNTKKKQA